MPSVILDTNVPAEKFAADFLPKLTKVLSETIGKSEDRFAVTVHSGLKMSFGGTEKPCANVQVYSIGMLGEKDNQRHSAKISVFLKESLGINSDRMYIVFTDIKASDWGAGGTTVAEIRKK